MSIRNGKAPKPTRAELRILSILWTKGPCTVRAVHEAMNERGVSGYTTALKLLQVMHGKGLVNRDDSSRAHVFQAEISKQEMQQFFVGDLVQRLFDGSPAQLVRHALGLEPAIDPEQKERIEGLLSELEDA